MPSSATQIQLVDPVTNTPYKAAAAGETLTTNQAALTAGTDKSGTAAITSGTLATANSARRGLEIQNVGTNNIGVNEFGGTAAIGGAGTYTLVPGASMRVRTNRLVTVIAATAPTPYTATEW